MQAELWPEGCAQACRLSCGLRGVHKYAGCVLEGWRDPFVYQRCASDGSQMFQMILGSGKRDADGLKQGLILRYSSPDLCGPWRYEGIVATGSPKDGRVWECPAIVEVVSTLLERILNNLSQHRALSAESLPLCYMLLHLSQRPTRLRSKGELPLFVSKRDDNLPLLCRYYHKEALTPLQQGRVKLLRSGTSFHLVAL
jgi:sucrose-6-phosphate hydrolase SacC (GH32 family)